MDNGVRYVLENFKRTLDLVEKEEYRHLKGQVEFEYDLIKSMKKTGDAYDHFVKFSDNKHQYANEFKFLSEHGLLSNEQISDYLLNNYPSEINNRTTINDFVINQPYTNSDLYIMFNDFIRGIRANNEKNIIAVITSHDSLYEDVWDENQTLYYTGEGQDGDQSPNSAGNKALLSAEKNNAKIYLFDKVAANKYYYRGEVYISGSIKTDTEYDKNGKLRQVIKFPLKFIDEKTELYFSEEDQKIINKNQKKKIDALTKEQLHELAKKKKVQTVKKVVEINYIERDLLVNRATKNRANGKCDLCGKDAPFVTKDGPYLESHHVVTIAEGGPDVIYNTVALCPNCHRKIHSLKDPKDFKKLANIIYNYLLNDEDKENLVQWEKLFENKF